MAIKNLQEIVARNENEVARLEGAISTVKFHEGQRLRKLGKPNKERDYTNQAKSQLKTARFNLGNLESVLIGQRAMLAVPPVSAEDTLSA